MSQTLKYILNFVIGIVGLLFAITALLYFSEMGCHEVTFDTDKGQKACYACYEERPFWRYIMAEWHLIDKHPKYEPFIYFNETCHTPYDEAYDNYRRKLREDETH